MDPAALLATFTPEQLAQLKAMLNGPTATAGTAEETGRTPFRPRQLHNLTLQPTATDARPLFVWSAESPRHADVSATFEYPKLLWHQESGEEITVRSADEQTARQAAGYGLLPPFTIVIDPLDTLQDALERLTPAERTAILEGQKQERLVALKTKLAALAPEQIDHLLTQLDQPRPRTKPRKGAA